MSKTILITGASGFIGSHLVEWYLKNTNYQILGIGRETFAGNLYRLHEITRNLSKENYKRITYIALDLKNPFHFNNYLINALGKPNIILHLAASSHVDRSIENPLSFVYDNVLGTAHLLEWYRKFVPEAKFLYFSTDEVFGPAKSIPDNGPRLIPGRQKENHYFYYEWDRYNSSNPYAATKASAEELCLSYHNTYQLPILISHTMNVIGERQHPEKFLPLIIRKILNNEEVIIHADKECKKSGSRFYIHAERVAEAVNFILKNGGAGDKFNIVGEKELTNLELAQLVAKILNKELKYKLVDFHSSRPGHDIRYALSGTKLKNMGFQYSSTIEKDLVNVVDWYLKKPEWL